MLGNATGQFAIGPWLAGARVDALVDGEVGPSVCLPFSLSPLVCMSVCLSACLFSFLSSCMSVCLCSCLYVCMSVCVPVCMFACLSVCVLVCMFACLSVCLCSCPHACMSVYVSVRMFACLSVCMSMRMSLGTYVARPLSIGCTTISTSCANARIRSLHSLIRSPQRSLPLLPLPSLLI